MAHTARRLWNNRKLVSKHSLLLLAAALLMIPLVHLAQTALLQPVFDQIEQQNVRDQEARVKHALHEFETALQNAALDYAVWDDMVAYVQHPAKAFERGTLSPVSHVNNALDYRGIVRMDGTVIWSSAVDLRKMAVLADESQAMKSVLTAPAFLDRAKRERRTIAYVQTPRGVYLLASARIVKSDETGPAHGIVVYGKLLNQTALSEALQVGVTLHRHPDTATTTALGASPDHTLSAARPATITTRIGLYGPRRNLLATLDFDTPRVISAAGASAIRMAAATVVFAILALIALLSIGLRHITVRRLEALETYVRHFREDRQAIAPELMEGKDEIASLSRQFQTLSEQLDLAEEQLRQRSYLQGKADSAAGMLHNVRNALAPLRVMQEKWLREETLPYRLNMQRALDELADPAVDPARKASLEHFLITAARTIACATPARLAEMEEVKGSVDQIAEILGSYNFDTSATSAGDEIDLLALLRRQPRALAARGSTPVDITLPETLPLALGNRIHLVQVLDNIFVNAHEAMTAAGVAPMRLVVTCHILAAPSANAPGQMELRITDNGDGMDADAIARAFARGYSTRKHKSGGLGLHWSANVMRAMSGSIALESAGAGMGTTCILTLPCAPSGAAQLAA